MKFIGKPEVVDTDTNTQLTDEQVQDIVGAMFSGNTETNITATYQDADGTIDLVATDTNTNQLTEFTLTGDSGSNQTIAHGNTLDIAGGNAISTVVGEDTDTVTINHDDTSSQANVTNSGPTFLQSVELDQYGHVTSFASGNQVVHYQFLGYSIGDGSNYEMPQNLTDGQAPFEHADTSSADGLTIPAGSGTNVSEMIRMGGHVMPRAGTLKKWKGWASCNHNGGNYYVALFKWSPVENDNTNVSASHGGLTMLDEATIVGKTNDKVMPIDETSFTSASVAAGDILFTQVKTTSSGKTVYFNTTLEVEIS